MIRRPPRSTLFPSRRSSDLLPLPLSPVMNTDASVAATRRASEIASRKRGGDGRVGDRKSTRLNSSHPSISYAVFCLKKKKIPEHKADNSPLLTKCILMLLQL